MADSIPDSKYDGLSKVELQKLFDGLIAKAQSPGVLTSVEVDDVIRLRKLLGLENREPLL